MRAEMQDGMRAEVFAQVPIERRKGVRRGEAGLEEQPHRVAFVAEAWLHADEDPTELRAEHKKCASVALLSAGRGAPLRFDVGQPRLAPNVVVDVDPGVNVGVRAVAVRVTLEDTVAKLVERRGNFDVVAFLGEADQRVVERLVDRKVGSRSDCASIGREVEKNDRDVPFWGGRPPQSNESFDSAREHFDAVLNGLHRMALGGGGVIDRRFGTACKHHRPRCAIELRNRNHDRRFDRQQAPGRRGPLLQALKLDRLRGQVRHVQVGQHRFGGAGVVERWAADERKAGQRQDGIDGRGTILHEERVDRGTCVQPTRECGDDPKAALLERRDHGVVVVRIAREDVRAHD